MEGPASSLLVEQDTNVAVQWDTKASTVKVATSTPTLFKTSFLNKSGMEGGGGEKEEGMVQQIFLGKFLYHPKTMDCSTYESFNST